MNTTTCPDVLAALAADLADARYLFTLAETTLDLAMQATALEKFRAVCDIAWTFGIPMPAIEDAAAAVVEAVRS